MGQIRALAFDIGGTSTRYRLFGHSGQVLHQFDTFKTKDFGRNPAGMVSGIAEIAKDCRATHIGIAFAAELTDKGFIITSPNIWGPKVRMVPLQDDIKQATRLTVNVIKDVNAAALREKFAGVARDFDPFFLITVSSGVGGALFANGEVAMGKDGLTGGWGHLTMFPDSRVLCGCGNPGCLEAFSSGNAAVRIANERFQRAPRAFDTSDLFTLTQGGKRKINNNFLRQAVMARNAFALHVLDQVTQPLALAIRNQITMFNVEKIVMMGGFALSMWEPYKESLVKNLIALPPVLRLGRESHRDYFNNLIIPATNDDLSGVIGAAIATGKVKFS